MKDLKFEFEEKVCKHPKCKMKFKVLKGSEQDFHSENCRRTMVAPTRDPFTYGKLPLGKVNNELS